MTALYQLTKRNMKLYFRNRAAVFFSLLSVLIVLLLMLVFLGDMNKNELMQLIQQAGGTVSEADAQHVIVMWTIAGILSVNAFTVPVTLIGLYVHDREDHKLESLYTAPVSRAALIGSYLVSSLLTSLLLCAVILLLSFGYVAYTGYPFLTAGQLLKTAGYLLLEITVSSCLLLVIVQWVKSDHAWGAFSTLAGTLIGFLGGIYLPAGMLPGAVLTFLKSLPFFHEAALLRSLFTAQPIQTVFSGLPAELAQGYQDAMGIRIMAGNQPISAWMQVLGLCFCGIIALGLSIYLLRKHRNFDR